MLSVESLLFPPLGGPAEKYSLRGRGMKSRTCEVGVSMNESKGIAEEIVRLRRTILGVRQGGDACRR